MPASYYILPRSALPWFLRPPRDAKLSVSQRNTQNVPKSQSSEKSVAWQYPGMPCACRKYLRVL